MHLFEYATLRLVPRVEREEFLNVGVILFCAPQKFLKMDYRLQEYKIEALSPPKGLDWDDIENRLQAFEKVCHGEGPIGKLPLPARFRWLTANRSTIIQTSPAHPGFCEDAAVELDRLFGGLVL